MARRPVVSVLHTSDNMFAAAAVAHRINGGEYVKANTYTVPGEAPATNPKTPNRELMAKVLVGEIAVLDQDRTVADQIRTHFKGLTFQILKGKMLSEFDSKALSLANLPEISERDLSVVACLPSSWQRSLKRQGVAERLADCERKYLGAPGQKIQANIEVVNSVFSSIWNIWFITGITEDNLAVFFTQKDGMPLGTQACIRGKVKAHRDNFQTQLNYVKLA